MPHQRQSRRLGRAGADYDTFTASKISIINQVDEIYIVDAEATVKADKSGINDSKREDMNEGSLLKMIMMIFIDKWRARVS